MTFGRGLEMAIEGVPMNGKLKFAMPVKYKILQYVRSAGALMYMDSIEYAIHRLLVAGRNRRFIRDNQDFALPPPDLAYDAFHNCDWGAYRAGGERHAAMFGRLISRHVRGDKLEVLEWGCGPGRLVRHMPEVLGDRAGRIVGADYNRKSIEWCRNNFTGIEFIENQLMPPLQCESGRFDCVYCFSVFTHLSERAQTQWAAELFRVLKDGGVLIFTTHGENYRYLMTNPAERRSYDAGRAVIQGRYAEGKKWYFAFHPPQFVQDMLLRNFVDVQRENTEPVDELLQDVWVARKPARQDSAKLVEAVISENNQVQI